MYKFSLLATAISAALLSTAAQAEAAADSSDLSGIERISILGSSVAVDDLPGSGYYMDEEELARFEFTDIHRALANIPGVYVMEEDGYGLRANIGMRGTGMSRSNKITVMEDGIMTAPAPYASPSAYYFPTFGRMQALEVIKGGAAVAYGPRTTGGVLNLVSRAIPTSDIAGSVSAAMGSDGYGEAHAWLGGSTDRFGAVIEGYRYQASGFKELPNNDGTGFQKNDFMMKAAALLDEAGQHQLSVKLKYSDEVSDETYLGLTTADYERNPYQRYGASQLDQMVTEQHLVQLGYDWLLDNGASFSTDLYRNEFTRDWYKLSTVNGLSLGSGAEEAASEFDANGQGSLLIDVKANNRDFISEGVQVEFNQPLGAHKLVVGARYHEDMMDRFQWVDEWQLNSDYSAVQLSAGVPGTDSNRIDSAEALAMFVQSLLNFGELQVDAGVRFEDIQLQRQNWGSNNPGRNGQGTITTNNTSEFLPAVGMTYSLTPSVVLLAGVQKGFAPAAPGNLNQENEESINWEFGARYRDQNISGELIGFVSDYDNMHGNCTAAQGCDVDTIDTQFNAGQVRLQGLELLGEYRLVNESNEWVFGASMTFTDSEFQNSFNSALGIWGDVNAGDELPYQADLQGQLRIGYAWSNWHLDTAVRYMGEMRTVAGQGDIAANQRIPARTVVDIVARYDIDAQQSVKFSFDNVFDKAYIATRTNGGIQVGKPRTLQAHYQYRF